MRSNPLLENDEHPRVRFMLVLAYDGAPFNGWQVQPGHPSVQQAIEDALRTALRTPLHIVGAGRTDTGVNARHMTAHFDLPQETGTALAADHAARERLVHTLNAIMHPHVAIYHCVPVDTDKHARFDATARTYRYYLHTVPDPFLDRKSRYIHRIPDIELMNREAATLLGTQDFTSYSKLHTDTNNNLCTVTDARWHTYAPGHHYFTITANRFLRNMVRAITGTLLDVGNGKYPAGHTASVTAAMNRCAAGTSVPGYALYLWNIQYPYTLPGVPLPDNL